MITLLVNGTDIASLGFTTLSQNGMNRIGDPKKQGSGKEDYTSTNYFLGSFFQDKADFEIKVIGKFSTPEDNDAAIIGLQALFVAPGEKTITYTDGISSVSVKAILSGGITSNELRNGTTELDELTLKFTKTNDIP